MGCNDFYDHDREYETWIHPQDLYQPHVVRVNIGNSFRAVNLTLTLHPDGTVTWDQIYDLPSRYPIKDSE